MPFRGDNDDVARHIAGGAPANVATLPEIATEALKAFGSGSFMF